MKTAHPGLRSRSHFQSQATHKHLSNPDHQFSDPNHEKVTQMSPHGSPKGIPNPPKIYKHPCLDSHVSPWVSLGTPGSLKWYSKAPKWCPNGVPITPNGVPITQNGHQTPDRHSRRDPSGHSEARNPPKDRLWSPGFPKRCPNMTCQSCQSSQS